MSARFYGFEHRLRGGRWGHGWWQGMAIWVRGWGRGGVWHDGCGLERHDSVCRLVIVRLLCTGYGVHATLRLWAPRRRRGARMGTRITFP